MKGARLPWAIGVGSVAVLLWTGCGANYYRRSADTEVYRAIQQKAAGVTNMDERFTIEQTNVVSLEGLPVQIDVAPFLGPAGEVERGAAKLSLEQALAIALRHSRTYQSRKEQLYLTALGVTLARYQFTPIFSGGGRANLVGQTEQTLDAFIDPTTGRTNLVLSDNLIEQRSVTADGSLNASWLIHGVGRLTAAFFTDFFRYLTGDPRTLTQSRLSGTLTRPLLRNAGFKQQMENLTQAERDLLYAIRDFTRFRKDFSVQVATAYYGVLGARDRVRNSFLNLESSRKNAERTRELAQEGRVTQADLGRLRQQELSAESDWINALRAYQQALDDFKLRLGLDVTTNLVLDDQELATLEIRHPNLSVEDSIRVALAARLDYQNTRDRHEDAQRRVKLAANLLKPRLDLVASAGVNSQREAGTGFPRPDLDRYHWSAGLDVELPFDRKSERNNYRAALIAEKQAARDLEQQEDEIILQVRESWRTLDQARRNYEISRIGVEVAQRRVEEQNLLAELGRAKAQDQVDAQNDLVNSKNQLTQALVCHTIARLQFWNNLGILYIKDNGHWEELNDGNTH